VSTETAKSTWTWEDPNAVQIRVSLDGVEPAIFRRLVVPLDNTLAQLHHILQAAMGWTDSHLHQFEIGGLRFGDPELLNKDRRTISSKPSTPASYDCATSTLITWASCPSSTCTTSAIAGDTL
jgi:hypothetical protein